MVFHVPSFLAGSALSGTAFLLVNQQLSYRNRLTYKWPLAEKVETVMRAQWNEFKTKLNDNEPAKLASREVASFSTHWNNGISKAKSFFEKQ